MPAIPGPFLLVSKIRRDQGKRGTNTILHVIERKVLTVETMHPLVKNVEYAVRGALPIRAEALSEVWYHNNISENILTCTIIAIEKRSFKIEL